MIILHVVTGLEKVSGVTTFVNNVMDQQRSLGETVRVATMTSGFKNCMEGVDVVHIHGLWTPWLHRASVAAHQNAAKVVWSTHGMTAPWSLKHKWWKKVLPWYLYQRRDLFRADLIHSTCKRESEWNRSLGFHKQVIVPLGTRIRPMMEGSINAEAKCSKTLLYVGRVYPVKALDRLIAAFAKVVHCGGHVSGEWSLRIVGPDQANHMMVLKELVSNLKLDGRIDFVGPKFGESLDSEYISCDGLCLVSHTENFGATVVDAMAFGKPVITSTGTPWQEVLECGAGWWVDNDVDSLAKALYELMSMDVEKRVEMGHAGRKLVEQKYSWSVVAKSLTTAYQNVV